MASHASYNSHPGLCRGDSLRSRTLPAVAKPLHRTEAPQPLADEREQNRRVIERADPDVELVPVAFQGVAGSPTPTESTGCGAYIFVFDVAGAHQVRFR